MNTTPEENVKSPEHQVIRELDPARVQQFQEQIESEQNLTLALVAGGVAALIGAVLWGALTYFTAYQSGLMAIGIAFMVGWAVRTFGKGVNKLYGFLGAGLSFISCIAGNLFMLAAFIARQEGLSIFDVLMFMLINPLADIELLIQTFSVIDLLFYAFAIYYGYNYSFRRMTPEEQESLFRTRTIMP